jgi:hypothetical protein
MNELIPAISETASRTMIAIGAFALGYWFAKDKEAAARKKEGRK